MDVYISHMIARKRLIDNANFNDSDSSDDDEPSENSEGHQPEHYGGAVYMSADSDPNVVRISTWK